jgi:hypothetical protein
MAGAMDDPGHRWLGPESRSTCMRPTLNGLDIDVRGWAARSAQALPASRHRGGSPHTRHGQMVALIAPPVANGKGACACRLFLRPPRLAKNAAELVEHAKAKTGPTCSAHGPLGASPNKPRHRDRQRSGGLMRCRAWRKRRPAQAITLKRDLFRLAMWRWTGTFDACFDPPRQGAEAQAREIAKSKEEWSQYAMPRLSAMPRS